MEKDKFGIIGAGGQAHEAEQYLKDLGFTPAFFAIDKEYISNPERQIDVLSPNEYEELVPVIAAIGAPEVRRKMVESWKGKEFYSIVSEEAYIGDTVQIGNGSIIAPRAVLTANIEIGEHAIINVAATISHDVKLGKYVTVSPGAHIAGGVELGDGVFVGIGASISNGVRIAEGCVIGAGAVVINDVDDLNSVIVGVPGRIIKVNDGWLSEV